MSRINVNLVLNPSTRFRQRLPQQRDLGVLGGDFCISFLYVLRNDGPCIGSKERASHPQEENDTPG